MLRGKQALKIWSGLILIAGVVGLFFYLQMSGVIPTFDMIKENRMVIEGFVMSNPLTGALSYIGLYIIAIALSLPVATLLTVFSGFLFGALWGTVVVVIGATIGATIIFILARYFFRDYFTEKVGDKLGVVNSELKSHGFRDVLLLRLAPGVPFVLINAATALTSVKLRDYVLATLVGIVPFTFVYVLAGTRLAEIGSLSDILSVQTIAIVTLLVLAALVPIFIRRRRKLARS